MDELTSADPRRIGGYRLLGRLGTGGMGRVYLARSGRGRTVAVKLVRAELAAQEEFRGRFRREVSAARRVGGKWTAPVLDADTEAEVPWVATGYVAGPSLAQVVKEYGPLPERSVRVLAAGLAHALADIHAAGLVHRDLKPSNVMLTIDGPRVIDFGIARALETVTDASLTYTGAMVGSPAFMSPEQVRGDRVTPACDIFCLGSVLAYAATGLQPFGAAGSGVHAQMFRIVQEPPDLDAVPDGLRGLVAACLAKDPGERPSLDRVQAMVAALAPGAGPGSAPGPEAPADEPWLPARVVAALGRQAVRLLELEAAETGPLPVVTPREAAQAADGTGAADAVPATYAAPASEPAAYEAPISEPATYAAPAPVPPAYAAPATAPAPAPPAAAGRRARPLVAVLAAAVVAAAVVTAFVLVKAHHGGGHAAATAPPTGRTAQAGSTGGGTGGGRGTRGPVVPAGMTGTWRTSFASSLGENVRELTVHRDGTVELTGHSASYDCVWTMRVTSAGPPVELGTSAVVSGSPAGSCSPGPPTALTLVDPAHLRRDNLDGDRAPLTYEKVR